MSMPTVTQSGVPSTTQLMSPQNNTATQAVVINLKSQGQALQGSAQSLATTRAGMSAQMAVMNNPKASKQERAAATQAYEMLAQDATQFEEQMDSLKNIINDIVTQQMPQAEQADAAKAREAASQEERNKEAKDSSDEVKASNLDRQGREVLSDVKALIKSANKKDTDGDVNMGIDALNNSIGTLSETLNPPELGAKTANANSSVTAAPATDAYTGVSSASPAMSAQATVISDIAQGHSAEDIGAYLGTQGVTDPNLQKLVRDAVNKAKEGRFAKELAQGAFDELLGAIEKSMKQAKGEVPKGKATANAGRSVASVGGTSFAGGATSASATGAATTGGSPVVANAGGTTTTGASAPSQTPMSQLQMNEPGQTNSDIMAAQPATDNAIDSMSANELLMYVMLMATGELNKEMRDMAKVMKAQTEQKAKLRQDASAMQASYDAAVKSDPVGKPSDATTGKKQSLDDINNQLDSVGSDMQMQQLRMQQIMQVQQQMMTAVSSISKSLNDTSMSILRKIGG